MHLVCDFHRHFPLFQRAFHELRDCFDGILIGCYRNIRFFVFSAEFYAQHGDIVKLLCLSDKSIQIGFYRGEKLGRGFFAVLYKHLLEPMHTVLLVFAVHGFRNAVAVLEDLIAGLQLHASAFVTDSLHTGENKTCFNFERFIHAVFPADERHLMPCVDIAKLSCFQI